VQGRIVIVAEGYCSLDVLVVPSDVDVHQELARYRRWVEEEYLPSLDTDNPLPSMFFDEWLVERCSARPATGEEVVVVEDP